jgi:hypothetical protein
MQLITQKVPVDFNYFLFSCTHFGSMFHHTRGWDFFCDMVRSKIDGLKPSHNFALHHGDVVDFVDPRDPRFNIEEYTGEEQLYLGQVSEAKKRLSVIQPHLITILKGNHEFVKQHLGDATKSFCKDLKLPYGGWSCKVTFKTRRGEYLFKHYATHGAKGISSTADDPKRRRVNRQLTLKRLLKNKAADCGLMSRAHTHICERVKPESDFFFADDGKGIVVDKIRADYTEEYIHPDLRWYVSAGAFYKQYAIGRDVTSYAERRDYDPLPLGFQVAKIRNKKIVEIEPVWMD